jgi:glutathione synthase
MSFPKFYWDQALELAPLFNELVDRVSLDGEFLQQALARLFSYGLKWLIPTIKNLHKMIYLKLSNSLVMMDETSKSFELDIGSVPNQNNWLLLPVTTTCFYVSMKCIF